MTISVRNGNMGDDPSQPTPLSVEVVAPMIGLDLVDLEQCYLVIYSVYAAYMGQRKEAA